MPAGRHNRLIEMRTGRSLGSPKGETAWTRMQWSEVMPTAWSADESLLVWYVDGKWFPDSYVVIHLQRGAIKWQLDLLKVAQKTILARTRRAAPAKYAAAREESAGNGSAYPEGFSVDVEALTPISLPLRVWVVLTTDPKDIDPVPQLASHLQGLVDVRGKFHVTDFGLGRGISKHFGPIFPPEPVGGGT